MKLEKAKEILKDMREIVPRIITPLEFDAIRLGIEAMERHQVRASLTYMDMMKPLPSETEE